MLQFTNSAKQFLITFFESGRPIIHIQIKLLIWVAFSVQGDKNEKEFKDPNKNCGQKNSWFSQQNGDPLWS